MPVFKRQGTAVRASLQQSVSAMEAPEGGVVLSVEAWISPGLKLLVSLRS